MIFRDRVLQESGKFRPEIKKKRGKEKKVRAKIGATWKLNISQNRSDSKKETERRRKLTVEEGRVNKLKSLVH